jgi:hypothetical protein
MRKMLPLVIFLILSAGCVKIPVQSVELADALQAEGQRMHKINLMLLNTMFNAKKKEVDRFVDQEYTPELTKDLMKIIPAGTDIKSNLPDIMQAINTKVNVRKDSLITALEIQKEKLTDKLNTDYSVFENAVATLKRLLESATKVDKEKTALYEKAKQITNNQLDLGNVENALDRFIHSSGSAGNKINTLNTELAPYVNLLK